MSKQVLSFQLIKNKHIKYVPCHAWTEAELQHDHLKFSKWYNLKMTFLSPAHVQSQETNYSDKNSNIPSSNMEHVAFHERRLSPHSPSTQSLFFTTHKQVIEQQQIQTRAAELTPVTILDCLCHTEVCTRQQDHVQHQPKMLNDDTDNVVFMMANNLPIQG